MSDIEYTLQKPLYTIKEHFIEKCNILGDVNEHLPILKKYAEKCDHITEMGIRYAVSAWAFLAGRPEKFIGYDINYEPVIDEIKRLCENENIEFQYKNEEVSIAIIEQTDLLFIDTWHVYEQTKRELEQHYNKVNKYIILHDTETYKYKNEKDFPHWNPPLIKTIKSPEGIWPAVEEFLQIHSEWVIKEHFSNNNGLTIMERQEK